jgi:hypothetical protein
MNTEKEELLRKVPLLKSLSGRYLKKISRLLGATQVKAEKELSGRVTWERISILLLKGRPGSKRTGRKSTTWDRGISSGRFRLSTGVLGWPV